MSEIVIKIGNSDDPRQYRDGDIVEAFNRRRIRCMHAQHLSDVRVAGFTRDGLRPDGLARDIRQSICQYRFERISPTEVRRSNGVTEEIFGPVANARGEQIDVSLFLKRRLAYPGHAIFGVPGAEIWFGGNSDKSHVVLDRVWSNIEAKSDHREVDFTLWPLTRAEKQHFLCLPVDDFDEETWASMLRPETAPDPEDPDSQILVQKRTNFVQWRDQLTRIAKTEGEILNRNTEVDIREVIAPILRASIVETR